ncbi:Solute carrier family 25 member 22 [Balamuthia mandrillaris]
MRRGRQIVGLYKGAASPLAGCALYSSVLFLAYGQSKRFFQLDESPDRKDIQLSKRIGIGMTTGFCASLAEGPIDLIKSKMQVQYRISIEGTSRMAFVPYKSSWDCLRRILATYGIRGVYQGLSATFLRNMPGSAVYFTTYEVVRRNVATLYPQSETTSVLLAGAIAGITFWLSCFPADVIKSTLQTDASYKPDRKYKGILDCTRQIFRREGLLGFWKGFMPCLIRAGPVNAATFFVYENTRRMMD